MKRALILVLLSLSCSRPESISPVVPQGAPVIVISIDTLRADRLPAYGYGAVKTPAIDALRADSILYSNAWSHCPMTLPSHVSILTGLLPYEHGVRNNIGYRFDAAKYESLPVMLRRLGYATGAAVSAYVMRGGTGLGPAFDFYDDRTSGLENVSAGNVSRSGSETLAAAEPWIAQNASRPFFFLFHIFEPHAPYEGSYDAEVEASDAIVGRFIEKLKAAGVYQRATIIFLSDHGEGLGDHGEGEHGVFLYREALHVPLMIKLPNADRRGTKVDAPVQLIDVAPTVAVLAGEKPAKGMRGLSLVGALPAERSIYSETLLPRIHFGWSDLRSIAGNRHHFIEAPRPELYDYVADPREKRNIISEERRTFAAMKRELERHAAAFAAPSSIDSEEAEKLAALGYIGQARTSGAAENLPDPKDAIGDLEALRRASAVESSGDLRGAAAQYRALASRNPRFADAWLRLATLHERFGERDAAIDTYRRALTAAPELASHLAVRIGSLYLQTGKLDEAAAHAELALKSSPGAAHHLLGRVALARRDFATAEREARAAAEDPAFRGPAAVLQALVLVQQGRLAPALHLLDRVRSETGAATAVRDLESTRGDILARMERGDEAEAAFQAEIRSFPQNREAWSRLALLYFASGKPEEGAGALEKMFEASRDPSTAVMAAEIAEAVGENGLAAAWRRRAGGRNLPR
jgi:tetratricopeptide (TPR) repeat protein